MLYFDPHFEILPEKQKTLWNQLAPCARLSFVLYGGTAIALQLGHRQSLDFNFFSHLPLNSAKEESLYASIPILRQSQVTQKEKNTISCMTPDKVHISFFGEIHFGRVGIPLISNDGIIQVASLDDLLGLKLAVIMNRVVIKDYIDIAAILESGKNLKDGLEAALALFDKFPPMESVRIMTYFPDDTKDHLYSLANVHKQILIDSAREIKFHELHPRKIISKELTSEDFAIKKMSTAIQDRIDHIQKKTNQDKFQHENKNDFSNSR